MLPDRSRGQPKGSLFNIYIHMYRYLSNLLGEILQLRMKVFL